MTETLRERDESEASSLLAQQSALAQFGEFALRSENLDEILHEACRLIGQALGTDLSKVMELQEDGRTLLVRAGVGWKPGVVGKVTIRADENTSEGHALNTREPMISADVSEESRFCYPRFLIENGVQAIANVPIIGGQDAPPYGLLQIDSRRPRQFTDSDTAFLTTYANLISAAVQRLRITSDLRDRESQLRHSEERFRRVAEIETVAVIFFDMQGRIVDGNAAFFRMSRFDRADLENGQLRRDALTPPEWVRLSSQVMAELKETGQGAPSEREYCRKDGSRWWGLATSRMLDDQIAVELVLDITGRKAVEQALRDSEARLRSLIDGIPQLVFRSRSSGDRIWGSPQWIAYTGLPVADSVGFGWLDAVHPDDRASTMAAWHAAESSGLFAVDHRIFHAAEQTYRWFQSRATPVRGAEGDIVEWFGTSTDIDNQVRAREMLARSQEMLEAQVAERTAALRSALEELRAEISQREQAEAALRHAQKIEAVGQLTGGIAHDFNNMLQGIAGSLELARRRAQRGQVDDVARFLDAARQAVDRAAGLTRRLLAFARRQRLHPRAIDADALVAGMGDLIRRTVGPGVRLELHLRDGRARILCDPAELESALLNLCINARDAMPDGGVLTLATEDQTLSLADLVGHEGAKPGPYVVISVSDTGKGMPANVAERAFEPFFTTKPLGQGTGLGLSQVYGFVRQSDGIVRIQSAPDRGTTVRLYLPQRHGLTNGPDRGAFRPVSGDAVNDQTVLLVDDEALVREAVAERLRDIDHRVLEAADGPSAVHLLDGGARFDLLVTDVGLPNGMNGRQLAEVVRERFPSMPVIFITGFATTTLPEGSEIIGKPFELDDLLRRVQVLLNKRDEGNVD